MKKLYLFIVLLMAGVSSFGQAIPNVGMENWRLDSAGISGSMDTVEAPIFWYGADSLFLGLGRSLGSAPPLSIPVTAWHRQLFEESATAYVHGGSHSAKLITAAQDTITAPGVLSNAQTQITISIFPTPKIGGITYTGGTSVTVKPTSVSAWVQYYPGMDTSVHPNVPAVDSGYVSVQALAHIAGKDSVIGTGSVNIGPSAAWMQVTANINYPKDTTDTITILRITFVSSGGGITLPTDSSTLYVDDVTMTSIPEPIPPVVISHVGVNNVSMDDVVKVYPNPASGKLYISSPQNAGLNCRLFSLSGQQVISKPLNGDDTLDVSTLPPGFYIYTVSDADGNTTQRGKVVLN